MTGYRSLTVLLCLAVVAAATPFARAQAGGDSGKGSGSAQTPDWGWGENGGSGDDGGSRWGEDDGQKGEGSPRDGGEWNQEDWVEEKTSRNPDPEADPKPSAGPELAGNAAKLEIGLWFVGGLPLAGQAGSGTDAPEWSEAFGFGFGGGGSLGLRLVPCLSVRLGIEYWTLDVRDFQALGQTNRLSDLGLFSIRLCPRFFILTDRTTKEWFEPSDKPYLGPSPYIGWDFGISINSSVSWSYPPPSWAYWDSGVVLTQEFVLGLEYRFIENVGIFVDLAVGTIGAPAASSGPAGSPSRFNEAGSPVLFRFKLGMVLAF